jgi:transposase
MRPHRSPGQWEARRRPGGAFLKRHLSQREITRCRGCDAKSVLRGRDACRANGTAGLQAQPATGRPPKLKARQNPPWVGPLADRARAHGDRTEWWTTQRIADRIAQRRGSGFVLIMGGKRPPQVGWSHPQARAPSPRAGSAAIKTGNQTVWPRVNKRRAAGCPPRLSRGRQPSRRRRGRVLPASAAAPPRSPHRGAGYGQDSPQRARARTVGLDAPAALGTLAGLRAGVASRGGRVASTQAAAGPRPARHERGIEGGVGVGNLPTRPIPATAAGMPSPI